MDRSWIQLPNRLCKEYENGIASFIKIAKKHLNSDGKTRCPCRDCLNTRLHDINTIQRHFVEHGFSLSYHRWNFHGEDVNSPIDTLNDMYDDDIDEENEVGDNDELLDMLNDVRGPIEMHVEMGHEDFGVDINNNLDNASFERFDKLFEEARRELYPGCSKFSVLDFVVKLLHIKVLNQCTNKTIDMLLQLLKAILPDGSNIPTSYYDAKKMLRELGLGYESIHACKYDCVLFWKEHAEADKCPVCNEPRYKINDGKGKKIPQKILRYFPLKPRLQRLFMCKHTACHMRWHKEKRVDTEGILRHPADSEAWKDFDKENPEFALDSCNVRLGLATDGFNPFGNMSNAYSMWPVVLIPYNLPPWKCMKEQYFMMSLLIPGPTAPGRDIDVYLRPLIDELKELWDDGVQTYDAYSRERFYLHAAVIWTINDFPAYGNLSGWSTKGYKACPVCNKNTTSQALRSKICYMGHRRFLPSKNACNAVPKVLNGEQILQQLTEVPNVSFGKHPDHVARKKKRTRGERELNWSKKSIFF